LLAILTLLAAAFCVYGQTLDFDFIVFDDPGYVAENPMVLRGLTWEGMRWALTAFDCFNWHPLTWLSLMADAQFYGRNAGGYHLTNLLLHAANGALLFVWLRRATGDFWPSVAAALFFAIHPLHVESVAWISERKDVLSMFFGCLTLLAYTHYARGGGRRFYALALALFALGLTAKPMLVTLPALLLLLDFWPLRRLDISGRGFGRLMIEKTPFFLLVAASCAVTMIAQRQGGAVVPVEVLSVEQRPGRALVAYAAYLGKTFWPVNLGVYYPFWPPQPLGRVLACAALLAAVSFGAHRLRRRAPYLLVGWFWFLGTLVPVIGLVQVGGQAMADRYAYLPHVGLFIMLGWAAADGWRRWPRARPWLAAVGVFAAAACLLLGCRQAAYWKDGPTLFTHTLSVTRPTPHLYNLLGDANLYHVRFAEADAAYQQAWRLQPNRLDTLYKMGLLRLREGRWEEAATLLTQADQKQSGNREILSGLGQALAKSGRIQEAIQVYQRWLLAQPGDTAAHLALADALLADGRPAEAVRHFEKALALDPASVPALTHFAWLLATGAGEESLHDPARALDLARRAVTLTHGRDVDSLDALAAAAAAGGRWNQAAEVAKIALAVADQPGAPPDAVAIRRERLEHYRLGQWPQR
jgi:tetratricopeptide (TPR) repeat protein